MVDESKGRRGEVVEEGIWEQKGKTQGTRGLGGATERYREYVIKGQG